MRRRTALVIAFGLLSLAVLSGTAAGQEALLVKIREAALDDDGSTRVTVSVTGSATGQALSTGNFTLTEEGKPVTDIKVQPLLESKTTAVLVDLLMDTSGGTAGKPFNDAIAAAKSFVNRLPAGVSVGLVSFSDNVTQRVDFTTDRAPVVGAIGTLRASGFTALYDAVRASAGRLSSRAGQHNIVLFTDGQDNVRRTARAQAIASANAAKAPITVVGLRTPDTDSGALKALTSQTRGKYVEVTQSAALAGAFQQVATEIASQYVVTYEGTLVEPKELDISVSVKVGSATAGDQIVVLNSRKAAETGTKGGTGVDPPSGPKPLVGFFASKTGLYVGVAGVFLAVLLFFGMLLYAPSGGEAAKVLQRGLRMYTRGDRRKKREESSGLSASALGRRAVELMERVPKTQRFEERLQLQLDKAGWPLRSTEFLLFQIGGAIVGIILGWGLFGRWWLGVVMLGFGAVLPRLVLQQRVSMRESQFLSQLPDTLQLLAGSLQAGYGFMQALDTVVKEAPTPTSTEFSRVLTEARLGMPVEDALSTMSDRVGGEDFRWVVLAINIQRQVGGNLAALLQTVANTLREREMVRRQIKVLSAEGRLSAVILVILPFAIGGYVMMVNPSYLQPLIESRGGRYLIGLGLVLIGIGIVWMRKLIKIDV